MKASEYIKELVKNKEEIEELEQRNKEITNALISAMQKNDLKTMTEPDNNISIILVNSNKINFDIDKLEEKLDSEIFKEITDLHIELDRNELRNVINKHPEIKKTINTALIRTRTLNQGKLNQLLENDSLSMKDIEGTYTKMTSTYLRINK